MERERGGVGEREGEGGREGGAEREVDACVRAHTVEIRGLYRL
jgi:hypothetical protein